MDSSRIILTILLIFFLGQTHSQKQEEHNQIKVISFNIHHGYTNEGVLDLTKIGEQIKGSDPDIVAFQEVDVNTKRSHGLDMAKELGVITGLTPVFGKAIDLEGGGYGLAILTKFPIVDSKVHFLPNSRNAEQRIALEVILDMEGRTIRVVNVHLDYTYEKLILKQSKYIGRKFSDGIPTLMMGDFNQTPNESGMQYLKQQWKQALENDQFTYPSHRPSRKIDYLLIHPSSMWRIGNPKVLEHNGNSDHLAIMASFFLNPE